MRLGWSIALLVMLAGCADGPQEGLADEEDLAGADPGRQGRAASAPAGGPVLPDPIEIAWDGALDLQACAPSGPNSCMGATVPTSGKDHSLFLEVPPASWNGLLTLTWEAATPALDRRVLGVSFYKKCGATCWESIGDGTSETGTSPVRLDARSIQAPVGSEGLWISVRDTRLTPDPVYAQASPGQDFRVEGRLDPSAPAAGDA